MKNKTKSKNIKNWKMNTWNKKGFVFTIITIFLTSIIVVFFILHYNSIQTKNTDVKEVEKLNSAIEDFEKDLNRGLYITSFRSVMGEIEKITKTGKFLNNTQKAFEEAMLNSTVENESLKILENSTFKDWIEKTKTQLYKKGIIFSYKIKNLTITQDNYTHIKIYLELQYNMSDYKNKKKFVRTTKKTTYLPLQGLEDPVYFVKSNGKIANIINFTNNTNIFYLINVSFNNSLYIHNNKSPNFLMRLEGNFNNSTTGIESIANGQRFYNIGVLNYTGRSSVDAMYFSNISHTALCVNNTPNWFRIDNERKNDYNNITIISC